MDQPARTIPTQHTGDAVIQIEALLRVVHRVPAQRAGLAGDQLGQQRGAFLLVAPAQAPLSSRHHRRHNPTATPDRTMRRHQHHTRASHYRRQQAQLT